MNARTRPPPEETAMPKLQPVYLEDTFRVASDDDIPLTGPMTEKDARAFLGLLEAAAFYMDERRYQDDSKGRPMMSDGTDIYSDYGDRARTAYRAVMEK
jgi:hypothetical protein